MYGLESLFYDILALTITFQYNKHTTMKYACKLLFSKRKRMKKYLIFYLLVLPLQHFAQEVTLSLPEMNLSEEFYFDNWVYNEDTFFVVPVQLNEFVPLVAFYFNITYNPTIIEPYTEYLSEINADIYIMETNFMDVANFSMVNDGNLTTEVFSVSENQEMMTVSFNSDSATQSLYGNCNGNLMYLAFKKVDPCNKSPISLSFWDGDLGTSFVNQNQTQAFGLQAAVLYTTAQGTAYGAGGEITFSYIQGEVLQNGDILEAIINGGTPPYNYQWEDKEGNVLNNNSFFYPEEYADYLLLVTDANDCEYYFYVTFSEQSTVADIDYILQAYPNPVKDQFSIDVIGNYHYRLTDVTGKLIMQGRGENQTIITRGNISMGVYFLTITKQKRQSRQKLIFN